MRNGQNDIASALLEAGADVNAHGSFPQSPLSAAVHVGNYEMVQLLVEEYHADVNAELSLHRYTPLQMALHRRNKDIIKFLIEAGADVNARNGRGETPLSIAISKKDYGIVKMLLERGASIIADIEINHLVRAIEEKDHMIVRLIVSRIKQILQESHDQGIISEIRRYVIEAFDFIKNPPARLFARGTTVFLILAAG